MEARDAAKQPIMHRTACHNTEVRVLIVNSAQVEKLWYKQEKKKQVLPTSISPILYA